MSRLSRIRQRLDRANQDLRALYRVDMHLMHEQSLPVLLRRILAEAKALTASDGGVLFLADPDADPAELILYCLDFDSLSPTDPLRERFPIDDSSIAGRAARLKQLIVVKDVYELGQSNELVLGRAFDERHNYRRRSMLHVPMVDHRNHLVGLLMLVNRKSDAKARLTSIEQVDRFVMPFSARDVRLARSLASHAAVAIERAQLHERIEHTLESIIEVMVEAVDRRDPAVAGHSRRVAELSTSLANAMESASEGPYRHVRFTPAELRELRLAALLHDVGKLVVPEEVLLKAKKLPPVLSERVADRFDLIRRTVELEHCRGSSTTSLHQGLEELARMRATVRRANEPSELDSELDSELVAEASSALQDIARCRFRAPDGSDAAYLSDDELHYLQLPRGTLDDRERTIVEQHVDATYQALATIPWTDDLKNLPLYAYGHHEKLDGSGYPRRLTSDDIPLQTRIITIADIFDALTQADRPYKPALSAARALEILQAEADAGHVDAALVQIMIQSRKKPGSA